MTFNHHDHLTTDEEREGIKQRAKERAEKRAEIERLIHGQLSPEQEEAIRKSIRLSITLLTLDVEPMKIVRGAPTPKKDVR